MVPSSAAPGCLKEKSSEKYLFCNGVLRKTSIYLLRSANLPANVFQLIVEPSNVAFS